MIGHVNLLISLSIILVIDLISSSSQQQQPGTFTKTGKGDGSGASDRLLDPVYKLCRDRIIHETFNNTNYFFSWRNEATKDTKVTWFQARNICRKHCMDSVAMETVQENEFVRKHFILGGKRYMWTSGRKCNFAGCDRADLQPSIENGWYWTSSNVKIPSTRVYRPVNTWGNTGASNETQPDNREFKLSGKNDEACITMMNNFYNDGVVWHDVACYYPKYFVCEDNPTLLRSMKLPVGGRYSSSTPTTSFPTSNNGQQIHNRPHQGFGHNQNNNNNQQPFSQVIPFNRQQPVIRRQRF